MVASQAVSKCGDVALLILRQFKRDRPNLAWEIRNFSRSRFEIRRWGCPTVWDIPWRCLFDLELTAVFLRQLGRRHRDFQDAILERRFGFVGLDALG